MSFDRFSPHSFERFTQSLCAHVFGPGLVVFGKGPDGGREATYEGTLPGFEGSGWEGYTVVQAKCREQPKKDARDARWLARQLSQDLQKFVDDPQLRPPECYLLCSNVELSSVPRTGGKAIVEKVFKDFQSKIGLKKWHVWSADEIATLLDDAREIRLSYAAWLTPSDILAELLEQLAGPKLKALVPLALARDLRTERDVRLRDAGQETDKPIYLESVFMDLPVDLPPDFPRPVGFAPQEFYSLGDSGDDVENEEEEEGGFTDETPPNYDAVYSLVSLSADKFDPQAVDARRKATRGPLANRVVILGGPGQGKSTLSQFLVQLFRAKLLRTVNEDELSPETNEACSSIIETARSLKIDTDGPVRFPVRVDLPAFADLLAKSAENALTILDYIAQKLERDLSISVGVEAVRKLLGQVPWLVVFDGLDEVPPSANRREVLASIDGFWDEVYREKADVLVVVTTRPQGYDHDLDPAKWQHWTLTPLSPDHAIKYAEKLATVRLSEEQRKEEILADISRACHDPSTSLLTTSPLQVAILFGISFLKGSIPQDRWELFDRYYTLLREREAQKQGATAKFIRDNKRTIDVIHQVCGWVLQVQAEKSGRTGSHLTMGQFKGLIRQILLEEGYGEQETTDLTSDLARIATNRLVLLATRVEDQVSFDVRSLQEYMAAAKIVGSNQELLVERLKAIAASAHWRHVFRIAASKVFSITELGHLRPYIVNICDALDMGDLDEDAPIVGSGAKLALDLLFDGVAATAPKFQRSLAARAITSLDIGSESFDERLIIVGQASGQDVLRNELSRRLNSASDTVARASLRLLVGLASSSEWASGVIEDFKNRSPERLVRLARGEDLRAATSDIMSIIRDAQRLAGEEAALNFATRAIARSDDDELPSERILFLPTLHSIRSGRSRHSINIRALHGVSMRLTQLSASIQSFESINEDLERSLWPVLNASKCFSRTPNSQGLSDALGCLADEGYDFQKDVGIQLAPWPLQALAIDAAEGAPIGELRALASSGKFGTVEDWEAAETRWAKRPLGVNDYLSWNSGHYLNDDIANVGAPPARSIFSTNSNFRDARELIARVGEEMPEGKLENLVWLCAIAARTAKPEDFPPKLVTLALSVAQGKAPNHRRARILSVPEAWASEQLHVYGDEVGRTGLRVHMRAEAAQNILAVFNKKQDLRGLLPLAVASLMQFARSSAIFEGLSVPELDYKVGDPPTVKGAVALFKLMDGAWSASEAPAMAEALVHSGRGDFISIAADLVRQSRPPGDESRKALSHCIATVCNATGIPLHSDLLDVLRSDVGAYPTGLSDAQMSERLMLPCWPQSSDV